MKKLAIFVVALVIGAVFGVAGTYYYTESQVKQAFEDGMSYQEQLTPSAVTPASVSMSFDTSSFNLSSAVDSDGAVTTETSTNNTLTITNDDETRTAKNTKIMLTNPVTGTDGLHDNLETDSTEISVTIGGVTSKLYRDDDYTSGVELGYLASGDEIEVTVKVTFETAVDGTFQDAQEYDCNLYFYQPNATYAIPISFTVST
ncbi:MAG: hypothetical protein ACOC80_14720 [Petrotogales bacterium]